ncbi:MAG: hypothetical protein GY927_08465 [bacterium]|nr:hypothetical protein [bacterium]
MIGQWLKRLTSDGAARQAVGRHPTLAEFVFQAIASGEEGFEGRIMEIRRQHVASFIPQK